MSADRFTLDTNVLICAADLDAGWKHGLAVEIIDRAAERNCVLLVQALAELFAAVTRKGMLRRAEAADLVRRHAAVFPIISADQDCFMTALAEAETARLSLWDALLMAAAGAAGCVAVLSEDMHDGARFAGVTVRSPFADRAFSAPCRRLLGLG
jgi:predicted nucleic acid-binding protein